MAPNIFPNHVLRCLREARAALGFGVSQLRTAAAPLIAKAAGYDWLAIDAEHGTLSLPEIAQICLAALPAGITPIVRVNANALDEGTRVLDNGAQGILVPTVENADQARRIVDTLCYPPVGRRGWGTVSAQFGFRTPASVMAAQQALHEETLVLAMIETREGVANADAISKVPGISGLFIGALDLSLDMRSPGFEDGAFQEAVQMVIDAGVRNGKFVGLGGVYDERVAREYFRRGARLIAAGSDQSFLIKAASERASSLRQLFASDT